MGLAWQLPEVTVASTKYIGVTTCESKTGASTMVSRRRGFVLTIILAVGTLALAGPARATDLSGHWEGSWQSCTTPHKGVLRADFCKLSATSYQVNFRGR